MIRNTVWFLLFLPLFTCAQKFSVVTRSEHPSVTFCRAEIRKFLHPGLGFIYSQNPSSADWIITLKSSSSLPECAFAIKSFTKNKKQYVELTGATDKDLPCAVYTFLEKAGYTFEFGSYSLNGKIDKAAIEHYSDTIVPFVKYRGIRQHINFPMDLSSYSLPDAKQYIRNLARMRFNFIDFHSYPGQWYEIRQKDTIEYAGNFFYGDRHDIPPNTLFRKYVHNKKTFCIPEIEPWFDSIAKRSQMAMQWLGAVMNEAKRVGMKVQFSFEPRSKSTDVQSTVDAMQQIYHRYPQIDVMEMITEESGGWGPRNTAEETKSLLTSFFGKEILNDTVLTSPIQPIQSDLCYIYGQIGHILEAMDVVRELQIKLPPLKLGIYCTNQYNVAAYHLARKYLPADRISILPAHGSANVARETQKVLQNQNDWENTTIYSWLEFDGMMYLQQNGVDGIHQLFTKCPAASIPFRMNTVAFNHWRTEENKITARYASLTTMFGAEDPAAFYKEYAKRLGIALPDTFSNAMVLLQEAFSAHSSNIGFAWKGYWRNGFNFVAGSILNDMIRQYSEAREELDKCALGNKNNYAKTTVAFLDNRLRTTTLYLQAFLRANELNVPGITNERYNIVCNDVLSLFDECMKLYAERIPDRGCEGTLVSLYLSPVQGIKISRQKKTGVPLDEPLRHGTHTDAPAPPIFKEGN